MEESLGPLVLLGPGNPGCGEVEALGSGDPSFYHLQGLTEADVGSDAAVIGVVDQRELTVAYRADGVDPVTVADDAAVGEGSENVFAGFFESLPLDRGSA